MIPDSPSDGIRRLTVAEYSRLVEIGLLAEDERIELIDGLIVYKPESSPRHECASTILMHWWLDHVPPGWCVRCR